VRNGSLIWQKLGKEIVSGIGKHPSHEIEFWKQILKSLEDEYIVCLFT
jgi:hypothetical protein